MRVGYARVSSDGQDVAAQVRALRLAGVRRVVEETRSGVADRPRLSSLVAGLRPGDELVVWKVDRLARSLRGLLDLADELRRRGASLRSLTEPIDTATPIGRAFFQLLGVFAELERALIRERCAAGRAAARERGVFGGRPRRYCYADILRLRRQGLSFGAIGRQLGCSPGTAQKAFARLQAGRCLP